MFSNVDPKNIRMISFSEPHWMNDEQTIVGAMLQWSIMDNPQMGAVDLTEDYPHIQDLKSRLEAGEFGPVGPYVPLPQSVLDAEEAILVRQERDRRLVNEVDPIVTNPLRWADLTEAKQAEWTAYRAALLDISSQDGFPHNVTWPIKPE